MSSIKSKASATTYIDADGHVLHLGDVVESSRSGSFRGEICGFGFIASRQVVFYVKPDGRSHSSQIHDGWDFAANVRLTGGEDSCSSIIDDAIELGYTDPDNERLRSILIGRVRRFAKKDAPVETPQATENVAALLRKYVDESWPAELSYAQTLRKTPGTIPFELLAILNGKRF